MSNSVVIQSTNIKFFNPHGNIKGYLHAISQVPMLDELEEYELALAWVNKGDVNAAQKLVTSHLRLVAKIATGYKEYGLPFEDLISEGNIGIMQAVKRFNPNKGARLSTYASWWIKSTIQEFILKSWSLVKIGTTAAQKKLFFNLRSIKQHIGAYKNEELSKEQLKIISDKLNVSEDQVLIMNRRMNKDLSLQTSIENSDGESKEWQDSIQSKELTPEQNVENMQEIKIRRKMLKNALTLLKPREIEILNARRLKEKPLTLEVLSKELSISKERVRQIESEAIEKLQLSLHKFKALPQKI